MADTTVIVLWILLGAVAGMIYSLKRIFSMEKSILSLEKKIDRLLKPKARKKKK